MLTVFNSSKCMRQIIFEGRMFLSLMIDVGAIHAYSI
ncbi:hypothetical protein NPIL_371641, partial [Nephila pilipes]